MDLEKIYDEARYAAACPVSGEGTDGHLEGLKAVAKAATAAMFDQIKKLIDG